MQVTIEKGNYICFPTWKIYNGDNLIMFFNRNDESSDDCLEDSLTEEEVIDKLRKKGWWVKKEIK